MASTSPSPTSGTPREASDAEFQLDLFERASLLPVGHEVVDAPLEELGARRVPRTLRKANSAVHVYPVEGTYSLPMRRLFNALLALSHSRLKKMPEDSVETLVAEGKVLRFEASVTDLKTLIGWVRSGDNEGVYEMLKALTRLSVVWDVMDSGGEQWKKHSTMLSQFDRTAEGKVAWLWVPDLFGLLFDPANPYTPLDLELSRQFNSKYSLALYENTFRYRNIKVTPWRAPDEWKLLIAGHDKYADFREFKRSVLKVALAEIEKTPNCPIELELEEKRGLFNRVEQMRFKVRPKAQVPLAMELPADSNPALSSRIERYGVSPEKARQLLREYDEAYLLSQIAFMEREMARKSIKNPAGFFIKAVEERYQDELSKHETVVAEKLQEAKKLAQRAETEAHWRVFRRDEAKRWWDDQPEETREPLRQEFLEKVASETVRRTYARGGFKNKMFAIAFFDWLCTREGVLFSQEAKDLVSYVTYAHA